MYTGGIYMALSGTKTKKEMYSYLDSLAIAVLSTTSDAKPHAAVIYFVPDEDLNFYFITKSDTKKSQNLEKNNNAALTIVDPHSPKTIQATGTVEELEESEKYKKIMDKIAEENAKGNGFYWPPPLSKLDSKGDLVLYKFQPDWLRYADFTKSTKESIFYDIIPSTE
jgi:general stress protein 26